MKAKSLYHLLRSIILRLSCRLPRMTTPEHNTVHILRLLLPYREQNPNTPWKGPLPHLEDLYGGGDMQLYSCVVSEIMFYKEGVFSDHEYTVAQVDLEGICVGFVRMEHTGDHAGKDGSRFSLSSTRSSTSSGRNIEQLDITLCGPGDLSLVAKSKRKLASYTPPDPLPLAAIVAACSAISDRAQEPSYRILTSHRYWFAGLVSHLLIGENGAAARMLENAQRNEGVWQEFLQVVSDKRMVEMANMLRPDYVEKLQRLQYMPQARLQKRLQEAEADRMLAQAQARSAPAAEGL